MTMRRALELALTPEQLAYLVKCARIRDVSVNGLVRRLMDVISRDELVMSILDDGGAKMKLGKGEHRFSEKAEQRMARHGS